MSLESRVRTALLPVVPIVEPHRYKGTALEYITFDYDEIQADFAEGVSIAPRYLLRVRWYSPMQPRSSGESTNPNTTKRRIAGALLAAGCTDPSIVDNSDDEGLLYIFECEATDDGEL